MIIMSLGELEETMEERNCKNIREIINNIEQDSIIKVHIVNPKDADFLKKIKEFGMLKNTSALQKVDISCILDPKSKEEALIIAELHKAGISEIGMQQLVRNEKFMYVTPGAIIPGHEKGQLPNTKKEETQIYEIDNDFIGIKEIDLYLEDCANCTSKTYEAMIIEKF